MMPRSLVELRTPTKPSGRIFATAKVVAWLAARGTLVPMKYNRMPSPRVAFGGSPRRRRPTDSPEKTLETRQHPLVGFQTCVSHSMGWTRGGRGCGHGSCRPPAQSTLHHLTGRLRKLAAKPWNSTRASGIDVR